MHKPKYLEPPQGKDRWLTSYVDVITILLVLFVAAAANVPQPGAVKNPAAASSPAALESSIVAHVDGAKLTISAAERATSESELAKAEVSSKPATVLASPIPAPAAGVDGSSELRRIEARLLERGLDVKLEQRGLVISLPQTILFAPGRASISADASPVISRVAEVLREIPNNVSLIGHSDANPINTRRFRNNWELSTARSLRLLELLAARHGISEGRLSVASYAAYRPKGGNDTLEGRAANRRVEILILDSGAGSRSR